MAELSFERELNRMFAEAPVLADADIFALRVDERLMRRWTLRRYLIGGLGLVVGVAGGVQLLGGGVVERMGSAASRSGQLLTGGVIDLVQDTIMPQSFPFGAEIIWMAATLAVAAVVFAITRVLREF
jgi:hypothetical protein